MQLTIDIPDEFAPVLQAKWHDLGEAAREALAVAAIKQNVLSRAQARELLGISRYEMDGVLKRHEVFLDYSEEEVRRDMETARWAADQAAAERVGR